MRPILIISALLLAASCQVYVVQHNPTPKGEENGLSNQILGRWSVNESQVNPIEKKCPTIEFNASNSAILIRSTGTIEQYYYKVKQDSLILKVLGNPKEEPFFNATSYQLTIAQNNEANQMLLRATESIAYTLNQ